MSIVCEEVFDENSHPSIEEIRDYATKIGIDPDSEPQLLPLAVEGLMEALPVGWKPCYDDKSKSYYYYNNLNGKTQWEHPLDSVYRGMVKKARAESYSLSMGEHTEDASLAAREEISSYEEPPKNFVDLADKIIKIDDLPPVNLKRDSKLVKQKSESFFGTNKRSSPVMFSSLDSNFDGHPRNLEKNELKISGGGAMFLKSNTKKTDQTLPSPVADVDLPSVPRSILREKSSLEEFKNIETDKDDDEKKNVRFNLDDKTDDSTDEDDDVLNGHLANIIDVKIVKNANSANEDNGSGSNLKLIKPNPTDFIQPIFTISKETDSEDDSFLERQQQDDCSDNKFGQYANRSIKTKKFEEKADKKIAQLKQHIWEEKNDELMKFENDLQESHRNELERVLIKAKTDYESKIKSELENIKIEMENRNAGAMKEETSKYEVQLEEINEQLAQQFENDKQLITEKYDKQKDELEQQYKMKMAELEKELTEHFDRTRDEMIRTHNSNLEQLKQNHCIVLEELKRGFKLEEDNLRHDHKAVVMELKNKIASESNKHGLKDYKDDQLFDKVRCEKRLLEDKYKCLKEKYIKLKTEVKLSLERRSKKKEQGGASTTTGSETERSFANNRDRATINPSARKAHPPKHSRATNEPFKTKPEYKAARHLIIQDLDTSVSDRSESKSNRNDYDSSDNSMNPGRSKKKAFARLKSSSLSRINGTPKSKKYQRSCSPVENLRQQLQKLEDLEDQFPQSPHPDTYHLRYPFSDGQKFEGSSELEFFRHRIHLERDSIKRAKESLRNQKLMFQQRQNDLKLKHGSMARHTLRQLCQEEKDLTDMEVSLHRTRSLLGEKVIRLRHLEQSLQRATMTSTSKNDDGTLSDISSHSASSGISSTEFATADGNVPKGGIQEEHLQESSEIIHSLESLNLEIKEIWDVLRKQQQGGGITTVIPPLLYPDLGWSFLAGAATVPAPPSIPTLADRLHNYRQQVALANAQSTVVTHANQGATTTLVERTRSLRHWLKQAGLDDDVEGKIPQATL